MGAIVEIEHGQEKLVRILFLYREHHMLERTFRSGSPAETEQTLLEQLPPVAEEFDHHPHGAAGRPGLEVQAVSWEELPAGSPAAELEHIFDLETDGGRLIGDPYQADAVF